MLSTTDSPPAVPPLRWGILGSATIARVCVLPALARARNGTLHALASRSLDRARALAHEYAIPAAYGSYEQLLADPAVEAVYVPLPNHLHYPWVLRALAAGKHVLCEKPLARDAAEAQALADAARDAGRLLMEAVMYRFHPRSRRVKQLVAAVAIGTPRIIRVSFCFHHDRADDYRRRPEQGGGALLDVGCYGVSLARWLFAAEPLAVQASAVYDPGGIDLTTIGLLQFPDERLAVIEASFATALQQTYTVIGTRGAIELPHDAFIPWGDAALTLRGPDDAPGVVETIPAADQYQLMVEHVGDAARGLLPLDYPPAESVATMRALDTIARAARTMAPLPVPAERS